jgi:hypothetical protein
MSLPKDLEKPFSNRTLKLIINFYYSGKKLIVAMIIHSVESPNLIFIGYENIYYINKVYNLKTSFIERIKMELTILRQPEVQSLLTFVTSILILLFSACSILLPSWIWIWISSSYISILFYFIGVMLLIRWCARGGQYPDIQTANLEGETFLITGAGSGIGKETAIELAKRGARVVLFARRGNLAETISDVQKSSSIANGCCGLFT